MPVTATKYCLPLAMLLALCWLAPATPLRAFINVVVDAGHGGHDRGGIPGQRIAEKTMALDVALRLETLLKADNFGVVMTRDDDTFIPLLERPEISNQTPDAIFVSIHFDAFQASHAEGVTTIFWTGEGRDLAGAVHRQILAHLHPDVNRGIMRRPLAVLRHNRWPAILVEGGYLTSPVDAAKILTPEYRQSLAAAIADGILDYGKLDR